MEPTPGTLELLWLSSGQRQQSNVPVDQNRSGSSWTDNSGLCLPPSILRVTRPCSSPSHYLERDEIRDHSKSQLLWVLFVRKDFLVEQNLNTFLHQTQTQKWSWRGWREDSLRLSETLPWKALMADQSQSKRSFKPLPRLLLVDSNILVIRH